MKPTPEQFAVMCYLVLMDHHGLGYAEAHPNYAIEKTPILSMGYDAFGMLDSINQKLVRLYLEKWGFKMPELP